MPAAAGRVQHERLAGRDGLRALALQPGSRSQEDRARLSAAAAGAPPRRVVDALIGRQQFHIPAVRRLELDHLPRPAAPGPGPGGVGAQLLAAEQHGRHRLDDFDRRALDPARISGAVQAVLHAPRAGASVRHRGEGEQAPLVRAAFGLAPEGDVPERRGAFRRHALGHDLLEAAEHDVGQLLPDEVPGADRRRIGRVEDGALRRRHPESGERARIVRNARRDRAAEPEAGVGRGVGHRHVHAVARHGRGAVVIDMDALVADLQRGDQVYRPVVAVQGHRIAVFALRQFGDFRQHRAAGTGDDVFAELVEVLQPELVHHLDEAHAAHLIARRERIDIPLAFHRLAGVAPDERHQGVVDLSPVGQLQHRDIEAFHMHVRRVRADADAAYVGQVRSAGEHADDPAPAETGRGQHEVVEVSRAEPGIVGDVDVALVHLRNREMADEMLHGLGHGIDMARRARHRLGQHPALQVEHAGREVAAFAHDGAERRSQQRLRLLLDDRDQAVPHHLPGNDIESVAVCHVPVPQARRSSTILPPGASKALNARETKVEVCSSTISAGPSSPVPAARSERR